MSGPSTTVQLAKRRQLNLRAAGEQFRTPMLVPSFSSKGFPDVGKIIELTQPFLDSQILLSAYDLHFENINTTVDINFPPLLFVDSGGYEAAQERALQDPAKTINTEYQPEKEWKLENYNKIIEDWDYLPPAIFVNFDHPNIRVSLDDQIKAATITGGAAKQIDREFLIKPTTSAQKYLNINEICTNVAKFSPFAAIGVTEDEIGNSLHNRMVNIGKIRQAFDRANMDMPIHIFGSLDTVTTLLYFVMGADIFDGLTWLRYGYHKGSTLYQPSLAALKFPKMQFKQVDRECWHHNYLYLQEMEQDMRSFLRV